MSQYITIQIIKELGGSATKSQLIKEAKKRYPELTLSQYITSRANKAALNGLLSYEAKTRTYTIRADAPRGNSGDEVLAEWDRLECHIAECKACQKKFAQIKYHFYNRK